MFKLKNIVSKILILLHDILLFAFEVIKQIVLPTKKRKGNVLSSLFIFFVGLIERLIPFEHGLFKMARIFKLKYFKQGLIILGALLFLLSSFEWVSDQNSFNEQKTCSEHFSSIFEKRIKVIARKKTVFYAKIVSINEQRFVSPLPFNNSLSSLSPTKVFLLTRSLRI